MVRSDSICTGVRAFPPEILKKWNGEVDRFNPCVVAGMSVVHRYSPDQLDWIFSQIQKPNLNDECVFEATKTAFIEKGPGGSQVVLRAWEDNFKTFVST